MTDKSNAAVATPNEDSGMSLIANADMNKMAAQLQAISNFQVMVEKNLNSGQDFGVIPGTGKPTLLKPGAEKIQMLMGVTSEYEVTNKIEDYEKGFFAYTVRCTLSKGGTKITEGLGSCNTKEKRYRNQDTFMIVNTVLKMAKKRAQVDATLTIASLSNVFTQDIEDMDNFNQKERMDNMSDGDAGATKLTFGKHKGKTLSELVGEDRSYVEWLAKNAKQDDLKQAATMALNPKKAKAIDDAAQDVTDKMSPKPPKLATKNKLDLISIFSKNIAKQTNVSEREPANEILATIIDGWKGTQDDWGKLTEKDATTACNNLQKLQEGLVGHPDNDPFTKKDGIKDPENIKLPFD
ncbi:exodeoxyribonuclease X C-terminal domain-containing protein [Levilactobacillus sp. HBUAS70063]|uniref:exodeoxyribonuclease X C-terminal domain-containing protein n=1 Tax=Levilactobacillus sp. HBUAS70063 TaxID=3109359 RepID=UPI003133033F